MSTLGEKADRKQQSDKMPVGNKSRLQFQTVNNWLNTPADHGCSRKWSAVMLYDRLSQQQPSFLYLHTNNYGQQSIVIWLCHTRALCVLVHTVSSIYCPQLSGVTFSLNWKRRTLLAIKMLHYNHTDDNNISGYTKPKSVIIIMIRVISIGVTGSGTHCRSLLFLFFLLGQPLSKEPKAPLLQMGSRWNLAELLCK